ncbi:transcriptional regulator [Pseudomonas sp. Leaf58]|uniref:histone-like nucleoid-structuring protein, MvaT/MvaU family n=1 Tax=Pseudomonas TaxID=286 RepID=UPI0006FA6928|nr:histone-like nucleoid-structuring protein, MvaT/MvaU family [Pseudomonas sp. Leaf58]AYG44693.1 transcriptional regulator [Pseudomonas sp. Leaf58]KQN61368.1 transcriptional regulator [Pseudomonas sp. Leaf58]
MSRLAEYRALERLLASKRSELSVIKIDPRLRREFEFESKLHDLLAEYQFGLSEVLALSESERKSKNNGDKTRNYWLPPSPLPRFTARQSKYYRNPYTGEVVEAKSTLHKTVKIWIQQYGRVEVERWATVWM